MSEMTRAEAIGRLAAMEKEARAWPTPAPRAPEMTDESPLTMAARDAEAIALAIRAMELLGDVAACSAYGARGWRGELTMDVVVPHATWDAIRTIASEDA